MSIVRLVSTTFEHPTAWSWYCDNLEFFRRDGVELSVCLVLTSVGQYFLSKRTFGRDYDTNFLKTRLYGCGFELSSHISKPCSSGFGTFFFLSQIQGPLGSIQKPCLVLSIHTLCTSRDCILYKHKDLH